MPTGKNQNMGCIRDVQRPVTFIHSAKIFTMALMVLILVVLSAMALSGDIHSLARILIFLQSFHRFSDCLVSQQNVSDQQSARRQKPQSAI